jgi:hypothetical protein
MIVVPAGVKVHLELGHTDMRKAPDFVAGKGPGYAARASCICRLFK